MENTQTKKTPPPYRLYVIDGEGDKTSWTEIGAAWSHKDGKGFSLSLDDNPGLVITGRLALRKNQNAGS